MTVPFALTDVPGGMRVEFARFGREIAVSFLGGGPPAIPVNQDLSDAQFIMNEGFTLTLQARPDMQWGVPLVGQPVRIGEADTWYAEHASEPTLLDNLGAKESGTTIVTDTCIGNIWVKDKQQIPRAAVEALITAVDFRDCADPSTWVPLER
ncbi:hypothetical protein OG216_37375 [Streptomycetaceae bacterium NBC_01309]